MEFDSPEVAKEFPGLYKSDGTKDMMSDPVDYEEEDKKKKKDKKDSKKDKGYAALGGESSHDEDDATGDPKSPGKKKLKAFKLSGKKKDKEKDAKKSEKSIRKFSDFVGDRKSADKELVNPTAVRMPFSAERHRDYSAHRSSVPSAFMPSLMGTPKSSSGNTKGEGNGESSSEKSAVSALNAFLNAPAPLFLSKKKDKDKDKDNGKKEKELKKDKDRKKDKEHKKDKEVKENKKDKDKKEKSKDTPSSSVAKVKLKLMRSKNSLEDPHSGGDVHDAVSHQFPDDPESIAKEIKKYEQLLEQTHTQIKSSKKVSKKQEEQLWELQRTLTQLKRKLRSINALSSASMNINIHQHHQLASSTASKVMTTAESVTSNTIPPPPGPKLSSETDKRDVQSLSTTVQVLRSRDSKDDIQLDFTLKSPEVVQEPPFQFQTETETKGSIEANSSFEEITPLPNSDPASEPVKVGPIPPRPGEILPEENGIFPPEASMDKPKKQPVQRSLDFSDSNDLSNEDLESVKSDGIEERKPNSPPQDESLQEPSEVHSAQQDSPLGLERERMEVKVLVHNESRDDSSFGTASDDEDHGEPKASSSCGVDENIGNVVDDANAMIGSMHEELEAAAVVFGQRKFSVDRESEPHVSAFHKVGRNMPRQMTNNISKSEPTFGDQDQNDSSDTELIRDDEGFEEFSEDLIPELMALPIFETDEYLHYENEQLQMFNDQLRNEILKEELDVKELNDETDRLKENRPTTLPELQSLDMEQLIKVWQVTKAENEALHDNVNKLKELVVISRLEEFKLETRVRYLEDKVVPISPITITTPLQPDM